MRLGLSAYAPVAPPPRMPPGLVHLMEGLSRDVLRAGPTDLYQFCAEHMHKLLLLRAAHEGRTRTMTLEEKIARAQKIIRQRAEKRRRRYDEPNLRSPGFSDEEESLDNDIGEMPQGISPIVTNPESVRAICREADESNETIAETVKKELHDATENFVSQNVENVMVQPKVEERDEKDKDNAIKSVNTDDDRNKLYEFIENCDSRKVEIFKDQQAIGHERLDYDVEAQNYKIKDTTLKPLNAEDLVATEKLADKPLESETTLRNKAIIQECDELAIENNVFDSGKIENYAENEVILAQESSKILVNESTESFNVVENGVLELRKTADETINDAILAQDRSKILNSETTGSEFQSAKENTSGIKEHDIAELVSGYKTESSSNVDIQNKINETELNTGMVTEKTIETDQLSDVQPIIQNDFGVKEDTVDEFVTINQCLSSNKAMQNCNIDSRKKEDETENEVILAHESSKLLNSECSSGIKEHNIGELVSGDQFESSSNVGIKNKILDTELSTGIVTEKTIENKINDQIKDPILLCQVPIDENNGIKSVHKESEDALRKKIDDCVEIIPESNKSNLGIKTDDVSADSLEISHNKMLKTQDPSNELKTQGNEQRDEVTQGVGYKGKEYTGHTPDLEYCSVNISDNNESEKTIVNECSNVKIEVQGPSPLLEQETTGEIVDQIMDNTVAIRNENCPKENGVGFLEDENSGAAIYDGELSKKPLNVVEVSSIINFSSNEDEIDSASDNNDEVNPTAVDKNSESLDTDSLSYMNIPQNDDIDINALVKSDSTNDLVIEETTESISETNTEADERNESSNNTMDLETAAVTIQKVFRTFLFKSRSSTLEDVSNDEGSKDAYISEDVLLNERGRDPKQEDEFDNAKDRRTLGITRMDTVLQTVNEEKSLSLSTDDSSTLSSAATTIQAHVRGFLVRNRLHSNKTTSLSSLVNSDGLSSQDAENEQQKSKTVLNIHIVPDGGHFMSRDESMATSLDLPLDTSPPASFNLLPLSFDVSERRKLLKREDAIQSISPPSNNSGKLSQDSNKEVPITESATASTHRTADDDLNTNVSFQVDQENASGDSSPTKSITETALEIIQKVDETESNSTVQDKNEPSSIEPSADEMDVITQLVPNEENVKVEAPRLLHSSEFHDVVLPTCVSRSETAVVREFKNVLGYFLLWNSAS